MKHWLYFFIKSNLELPFRTFFRGVHFEGKENIPKDKPVLIAANHSGSFMDGVVVEYTSYEFVYTLVRGDAFNKPIFNKILRSMLLLPIYRARDAAAEKARLGNAATQDECFELFKKNRNILIFSEGIAYPEKVLRPLKKGTAAMAAEMLLRSGGDMDLYIVPCAINYSSFGKLRGQLQIIYDTPYRMKDHYESMQEDDKKFARNFTLELEERLKNIVVETKGDQEDSKELLHEILLNEFDDKSRFRQYNVGSDVMASKINDISDELNAELVSYRKSLKDADINDRAVSDVSINFVAILTAICTAAVSMPAALLYRGFWALAKRGADKLVKNIVLYDSVYLGLGLVLSMLFYIILLIVCFAILPSQWTLLWKFIILISASVGTVAWFIAADEFKAIMQQFKYINLKKDLREKIKAQRAKILSLLK